MIFIFGEQTGCRVGEILGMHWRDIDLPGRKIHVRQQMQDGKLCPLKDRESRIVPLQASLTPILEEWKLKTGGVGRSSRRGTQPEAAGPTSGGHPSSSAPAPSTRRWPQRWRPASCPSSRCTKRLAIRSHHSG